MKKLLLVTFLLGSTLLATSCSGEKTAETPPAEAPAAPAAAPAPAAVPEVVTPPDFTNPLVEETRPSTIASLKKATDPAARLKQIQAGRPDPFAGNPVAVTVSLPKVIVPPSTPTILPSLPSLPPADLIVPDSDLVLVPTIVLPNPTLAKAVVVTGIVQVGSSTQAIVKAPLEPSSRYVSPGQRIANGQVLVKRIEVRGSEPVVVLEQLGIEVVKFVGEITLPEEKATNSSTSSTATNVPELTPDQKAELFNKTAFAYADAYCESRARGSTHRQAGDNATKVIAPVFVDNDLELTSDWLQLATEYSEKLCPELQPTTRYS